MSPSPNYLPITVYKGILTLLFLVVVGGEGSELSWGGAWGLSDTSEFKIKVFLELVYFRRYRDELFLNAFEYSSYYDLIETELVDKRRK